MKGFTLTELLITIAITVVLAAAAVPIYGNLQVKSQLNESTSLLIQTFRTARENSESRLNNSSHGVKLNADSYVLYQGASYAARDASYDRLMELDSTMTLSTTIANGETNFTKGLAEPNNVGTITLTHEIGEEREITINSFGVIEEE
jgi:prepilin-type N-terminal cleavage/methylation domain-containing protein